MNPTKFQQGNVLRHVKTGGIYVVMETPRDNVQLEYCRESFYEYWAIDTNQFWLRKKSEMEDGRFELITNDLETYRKG